MGPQCAAYARNMGQQYMPMGVPWVSKIHGSPKDLPWIFNRSPIGHPRSLSWRPMSLSPVSHWISVGYPMDFPSVSRVFIAHGCSTGNP